MFPRAFVQTFFESFVVIVNRNLLPNCLVFICLLAMHTEPALALNSQLFEFPEVSNHVINDKPFKINIKTGANLIIEYQSFTPLICSIDEDTVHLKGIGLCTISAKQITGRKVSAHAAYQSFYINNAIAAGYFHSLRIAVDGNLYAWGNNSNGQLGDGTFDQKNVPTLVKLPNGVKTLAVATGNSHSLAIGSDGHVYAWGNNQLGQLGDGTTISRSLPTVVNLPEGFEPLSISAGAYHSLAIDKEGRLYAWGSNSEGQLGNGSAISYQASPVVVTLSSMAIPVAIAGGQYHSLAIGSDGKVYAWGDNHFGQLGNGTTLSFSKPLAVKLSNNIFPVSISAGANHSLALASNGDLYAWGSNFAGQLGDATVLDKTYPVKVALPFDLNLVSISAGANHSAAITANGELFTWGFNMFGQLGDGTKINRSTPTKVKGLDDTAAVAVAGAMHSMLLNSSSKVFAWGGNALGQLGIPID